MTNLGRPRLDERFESGQLDPEIWVPYYLAHWSSRAESAANWTIVGGELRLTIPPEHPLWCPDVHEEPLRVSCIQSGSYSGPLGSTDGPQPIREGNLVREAQPTLWGYTPVGGDIRIRMRGHVDDASMFAFWLSGIEDRPERSGEICVAEIFGSSIRDGSAEVGMGIHRFNDPKLTEAFTPVRVELDPTVDHEYGVRWTGDAVDFLVDGRPVHRVEQSPDYPCQLMIGVFDYPARRAPGRDAFIPDLVASRVSGQPITA